jgi:hypothetical protein
MNAYLAWHEFSHAIMQLPLWIFPILVLFLIMKALPQPPRKRAKNSGHLQKSQRRPSGR